jgi:hypothetical protein
MKRNARPAPLYLRRQGWRCEPSPDPNVCRPVSGLAVDLRGRGGLGACGASSRIVASDGLWVWWVDGALSPAHINASGYARTLAEAVRRASAVARLCGLKPVARPVRLVRASAERPARKERPSVRRPAFKGNATAADIEVKYYTDPRQLAFAWGAA